MIFFFQAIIVSLFAGINPNIKLLKSNPAAYFGGWATRVGLMAPFMYFWLYSVMVPMVGPFWGFHWYIFAGLVVNLILSCGARMYQNTYDELPRWAIMVITLIPVVVFTPFAFTTIAYSLITNLLLIAVHLVALIFGVWPLDKSFKKARGRSTDSSSSDIFGTSYSPSRDRKAKSGLPLGTVLLFLLALVVFGGTALFGTPLFRPGHYSAQLTEYTGEIIDIPWHEGVPSGDHPIAVSYEMGWEKAPSSIREYGAIWHVEKLTKQRVGDSIGYVCAVGWNGYWRYQRGGAVDYYAWVDAQAPNDQAVPRETSVRYSPSAFFEYNLQRHLYLNGYSGVILDDYTLEVDTEGSTWWVITVEQPTLMWNCPKVVGVLIVDPDTGEINPGLESGRWWTPEQVAENHPWIDRVYPGELFDSQLNWKGRWNYGWWSGIWGNALGQYEVVNDHLRIVWDSSDRCVWYAETTSMTSDDDSLIGILTQDTITGQIYRLVLPDTVTAPKNEDTARQRGKSAISLHGDQWQPQRPFLYNLDGQPVNIMPIASQGKGGFNGFAFTHLDVDVKAFGEDLQTGKFEFRSALVNQNVLGTSAETTELVFVQFVVDRFGSYTMGGPTRFEFVHPVTQVTYVGDGKHSKIAVTRQGDEIRIGYIETSETDSIQISQFENLSLRNN